MKSGLDDKTARRLTPAGFPLSQVIVPALAAGMLSARFTQHAGLVLTYLKQSAPRARRAK